MTYDAKFCSNCGLRLRMRGTALPAEFVDMLARGRWLRQRGRGWCRLALRCFRLAAGRNAKAVEPILEIARTYRVMGRPRKARRWYRRAIARQRNCIDAWLEGAETYPVFADYRRALWLQHALAIQPESPNVIAALNARLDRMRGWRRRRIERKLWPTLVSVDTHA
jgi:hypothetical protein